MASQKPRLRPTCEVDRHDNDHVEVKLGFHDPLDYEVDIYFFTPPTLGLSVQNPKAEFLNSMRSYVRLQTSPGLSDSTELVSAERVYLEAQRLSDAIQKETLDAAPVIYAVKACGVAYESYLKSRTKLHANCGHKKDLVLSVEETELLDEELAQTEKLNVNLRHTLSQALSSKRQMTLPDGSRQVLVRLGDYVSFLMVDYLSSLQERLHIVKTEDDQQKNVLERLSKNLEMLGRSEWALRKKIGLHVEAASSPEARADYLYKIGLLKKYFQRVLFIQVKTTPVAKKVFQPMAAIAAGLAAAWAGLFQQAQSSSSFVKNFGLTPTWILCIGVAVYIVKDRIKDAGKHFLVGRVEKVLPDIEKVLYYEGDAMEPQDLGRIRESVRCIKSSDLPAKVYDVRYSDSNSGLEAELGENIIHYSKKIGLYKKSKSLVGPAWGLREIIRFSLSHYFQNLDDPFKEISFIDDTGRLGKHEARRIYYAHLVFQMSYKQDGKLHQTTKVAKLVLDKQGLIKVSNSVEPIGSLQL